MMTPLRRLRMAWTPSILLLLLANAYAPWTSPPEALFILLGGLAVFYMLTEPLRDDP